MKHSGWGIFGSVIGLMAVGVGILFALDDDIQSFAASDFSDDSQKAIEKAISQAPPTVTVPESDYYTSRDPYCGVRPYINGYYGDKWVEEGHSRDDLEGFSWWALLKYGSDFH